MISSRIRLSLAACLALLPALSLTLTGCSSGWIGAEDTTPPLPGERIPALAYDEKIKVDTTKSDEPVSLPPAHNLTSWIAPGGQISHEGGALAFTTENASNGKELKRIWHTDVGDSASSTRPLIPNPVIVGDVIYAMDSSTRVSAVSSQKGKRLWSVNLESKDEKGDATGGGLAVKLDTGGGENPSSLFVSTGYGEVFSLNPQDGSIFWKVSVSSPVRSAPTYGNGMIFVVTIDDRLVALNADTGAQLWTHNGIVENAGLLGEPSPALYDNNLLVAYSSGELFSLRATNGQEQWSDNLAAINREGGALSIAAIRGQPVLAAGGVAAVAISNSGRIVTVDTRTGQRVWSQRISGSQMPWVAGSMIYLVTTDAELVAINLRNGHIHWVSQLPVWKDVDDKEGRIAWYGPVLAGSRLWLTSSNGRMFSFNAISGEMVSKQNLPDDTNRPPIVVNNTLYTLDDAAILSAWQ